MSRDILPIILVSARDATAAAKIISDLIDNEIPHIGKASENVWRIANKYYTVDVKLVPVTDAHDDTQQLHYDEDRVEAHIIYLTEDECEASEQVMAARARRGLRSHVRLALVASPSPSGALQQWASDADYELVPLLGEGQEEEEGPHAVARAREALHAHAWRGLVRQGQGQGGEDGEDEDDMDGFAAALGALSSAAAATRALEGAARLDAAEQLVAAFCRALALHPDDC